MARSLRDRDPARGLLGWFLRAPQALYRLHLGWLLGNRFLMLRHVGRKSGEERRTVLEVVEHDSTTRIYYVASGWGEKSQWLRNVAANPDVVVQVRGRVWTAKAERLTTQEAQVVFGRYAQRHPKAYRKLAKLMLERELGAGSDDLVEFARSTPLVALRPLPSP